MLSSFVISSCTIPSFNLLLRASFPYRVRAFAISSRLRNPTRFLTLPFKPFFATSSSFSSSSSLNPLNACSSRPEDDSLVILGIETSCDDTAAAIVRNDGEILSQVVSSQADVCIVGVACTPMGGFLGTLSSLPATKLGSIVIECALKRAHVLANLVQEVFFGNVLSANLGQAPARLAALGAGIPNSVVCTTINKVCSSGTKATMLCSPKYPVGY